ncbi:MAG: DUF4139 domain-containing protein [Bacteroidota bacterium]|nr:DUF4139 domain-containing protein [Bacteroidota bacterium]
MQAYSYAQEARKTTITSTITKVSLFVQGAQVTREADITIEPGTWQYMFDKLSPYIDDNSVQIGGTQGVTLLNVFKQIDYLNTAGEKKETHVQDSIDKIKYEIAVCKNRIYAWEQEIKLITKNNRVVQDKANDGVSQLEELEDYYNKKLPPLYDDILRQKLMIKALNLRSEKFYKQLRTESDGSTMGSKQIIAVIKSDTKKRIKISLTYYVKNCGWTPIYDVVFEEVNKPLKLVYKASAWQSTLEDWTNIPLKITTGNPNMNGIKPILYKNEATITWAVGIQEVSQPMSTGYADNNAPATVSEQTVDIKATQDEEVKEQAVGRIRKTEDKKGKYDSAGDGDERSETRSKRKVQPAYSTEEGSTEEDAYGGQVVSAPLLNKIGGARSSGQSLYIDGIHTGTYTALNLNATYNSNPLRIEFTTDKNYTFKTGEPAQLIALRNYEITPEYKLITVPKLEKSVFLTAVFEPKEEIAQLTAMANIYTAGDFMGTSYLHVNENDTLEVSLGRDKSMLVDRKKLKDYSKRSFSGNSKIDESIYEISVRNLKTTDVKLIVEDQIPLSNTSDIKVELIDNGNAEYDETSGKLTWKIDLKAGESIKLKFAYKISYPKKPKTN